MVARRGSARMRGMGGEGEGGGGSRMEAVDGGGRGDGISLMPMRLGIACLPGGTGDGLAHRRDELAWLMARRVYPSNNVLCCHFRPLSATFTWAHCSSCTG